MLTNLHYLDLKRNYLTGTIPTELAQVPHLEELALYNNSLVGPVLSELGRMESLTLLSLYGINLTRSIPASLCLARRSSYRLWKR